MPNTENKFKVGDRVILGEHDMDLDGYRDNWCSGMDQFVGTETVITQIYCSGNSVVVESNIYNWNIKNLKHVDNRFSGMLPEEEFANG
jgi:hypothetical protein